MNQKERGLMIAIAEALAPDHPVVAKRLRTLRAAAFKANPEKVVALRASRVRALDEALAPDGPTP